jgi:hypothetical protein
VRSINLVRAADKLERWLPTFYPHDEIFGLESLKSETYCR